MHRSLVIGGLDAGALRARLAAARVQLNPLAEALLAHPAFTTLPAPVRVEVVARPVDQPEAPGDGPGQRAPPGAITVASPPPSADDEVPKGFYLRRLDGALWLRGYRSWAGHGWSPTDVIAFVRAAGAPGLVDGP